MDLSPRVAALIAADDELAAYVEELRASRRTAEEAFSNAPIGMTLQRFDGSFIRVNQALCDLLGYEEAELMALDRAAITHPDDRGADERRRETMAEGPVEKRYVTARGDSVWVRVAVSVVRADDGTPSHLVTQIQDISGDRRVEAELRHAADHDALTGLLNRRRFERDLEHQLELCRRYGQPASVVLLDLDDLKRVNDTQGHRAGDALLAGAARVLSERLRAADVVARLGGDEFAVLLPLVGPEEALGVAEALVRAVGELGASGCTVSAGVTALSRSGPGGVAEVMEAADRAMYAAKRGGGDRAVLDAGPL